MKQLKIGVGLLVLGWLVPVSLFAQFTETKEISKRFRVSPETRIEISNKYGKIELKTWEKDSVVVEIRVRVEEKKQSKLEKSMDKIDFEFTNSQHFLIIRTEVGENSSTMEKEFLRFKETLLQAGGGNMEIDYLVKLPKTNTLKVENKFGDIFIGDYQGEVEIDLSNGNLKSHDFSGRTNITLNFADATINEIKNARFNCNYSDLYIKKAKSLRITGKSSSFEILEINELYADSRRDKYRIRLADMVEARGSFSNFRLNELNDRLTLRAEYGDLDIEKTASDFTNIFIESKSTDINLWFHPETDFGFEITHTKSEVNTDREIEIEEKETLDEKEGKVKLSGFFNKKDDSMKKLFINANSGEINIFSK
ncbi:hypothetical protein D1164_13660 [Mariniphaga sediminis]|uniref:DUF4097 domain-containing protein n=1 Tax=Mariniphaga sediminis TaxID=1628158 RepID=A0A399D1X0_9BACT|nr:DUF4097 family beta strand repeat-containing protein [Mariniphaga sediminis]RIH64682.1 hypothetical protein D1164_13660 [Mariniphaga sediminis]